MQDADIFLKTEAGRDEIKSRSRGLSMAIRAILLMVDGQRDVAALRSIIAGSKAPADTLDTLLVQGLIEGRSAPAAPTPIASISTPRSATMTRPSGALATDIGLPNATPPAAEPPPPPPASFVYDGPLDLTLPTLLDVDAPKPVHPPGDPHAQGAGSSSANRYEHLYTMMNEVVRDFLPAHRRYLFQLKIERCGTSDELLVLLDALQATLAKSRGESFASEVISRLRNAAG